VKRSSGQRRARARRGRPGRRGRGGLRLVAAAVAALFVAAAAVLLLVRAARTPSPAPFRFPPRPGVTPTAEITAHERAGLEAVLDRLAGTPAHVPGR
jgi:hypothetical protein